MHERKGFTLVELLVVIGVIGILATMVIPKIGRQMDNAKEQQCRTNLRNLQAAVVAFSQDHDGQLPRALSYEHHDTPTDTWQEKRAWVSWIPTSASGEGSRERFLNRAWSDNDEKRKSHTDEMADDTGCGEAARFAIEYGTLYDYVGDIRSYRCPVIEREIKKRKSNASSAQSFDEEDRAMEGANANLQVWRTYAMNPFFGARSVGGCPINNETVNTWQTLTIGFVGTSQRYRDFVGSSGSKYRKDFKHCPVPESSKLLLFAEIIPEYEDDGAMEPRTKGVDAFYRGAGKPSKNGCIDPENPDSRNEYICWDDTQGVKGTEWEFGIHSSPDRGRHTALVVFYDGHIEKVDPRCGDDDKYNTAWFLNRGQIPGNLDILKD